MQSSTQSQALNKPGLLQNHVENVGRALDSEEECHGQLVCLGWKAGSGLSPPHMIQHFTIQDWANPEDIVLHQIPGTLSLPDGLT